MREIQEHHHIEICTTLFLITAFAPKVLSFICSYQALEEARP